MEWHCKPATKPSLGAKICSDITCSEKRTVRLWVSNYVDFNVCFVPRQFNILQLLIRIFRWQSLAIITRSGPFYKLHWIALAENKQWLRKLLLWQHAACIRVLNFNPGELKPYIFLYFPVYFFLILPHPCTTTTRLKVMHTWLRDSCSSIFILSTTTAGARLCSHPRKLHGRDQLWNFLHRFSK